MGRHGRRTASPGAPAKRHCQLKPGLILFAGLDAHPPILRGVPPMLHTPIHGYINGQLRNDTLFGVLIDAIAEAMPDDVGRPSGCRKRGGRPEGSGLLVVDIEARDQLSSNSLLLRWQRGYAQPGSLLADHCLWSNPLVLLL